MHKLTKKIFVGSSILLLVFIVSQNLEADKLSSAHDIIVEKAIEFKPINLMNSKDSLSVLRYSVGVQASIQAIKDTNQISDTNMQIAEEVNQADVKREAIKVQRAINLRMKELLEQLVVRPKQI